MKSESKMSLRANAVEIDERDPDHAVEEFAFSAGGTLFLPGGVAFAKSTAPNGKTFGTIMLKQGNFGMHRPMTPATIRQMAASMLVIAGEIEQEAADQASALIDRARQPEAGK